MTFIGRDTTSKERLGIQSSTTTKRTGGKNGKRRRRKGRSNVSDL